jgi:hypothetical protein
MGKMGKLKVLVIGFNTRPLVYSLYNAGYEVYAVDFFGDLDLYPYIKDSIILTEKISKKYEDLKDNYKTYLAEFAIELLNKHPDINYLLIGSGLDDALKERETLSKNTKKRNLIKHINNSVNTVRNARNIFKVHEYLKKEKIPFPLTASLKEIKGYKIPLQYPFILKKITSSGGTNVYKITNKKHYYSHIKEIKENRQESEWILQDYIEGIPISCTVISNGTKAEIISINRQLIGMDNLNPPRQFMYCGNIVPSNIDLKVKSTIAQISLFLTKKLELKGINGFDFVLKNDQPYLMEINPRIPGSIRASEEALGLNLLELHIESFHNNIWANIINLIEKKRKKKAHYCTKLIYFAPKKLSTKMIKKINKLAYIHDKSQPTESLKKGEPVCTILFKDKDYDSSFSGALEIVNKIDKIIR